MADDELDDLLYEAAEGPALQRGGAEAFDEFDELDALEDGFDAVEGDWLDDGMDGAEGLAMPSPDVRRRLARWRTRRGSPGGLATTRAELDRQRQWLRQRFPSLHSADGDALDEGTDEDALDALEEVVADALAADDTDEFFRRVARGLRQAGRGIVRVARRAAPIVGRIARTVGPIARMIPLPQTQAIGRIAGLVGRLMADEADELDAMDELIDLADLDDEALDAAAPVVAGLAIRRAIPRVGELPRPARRRLVHTVTRATRAVARRQGAPAARAMPAVVRQATRRAAASPTPARALPRAVARTASEVLRRPQLVRRLAATAAAARPQARACPNCSRGRRMGVAGGGHRLSIHVS